MFLPAWQDPQPLYVTVAPKVASGPSIVDVFVGSLALTIFAVVAALVLGAVMAFLLIRWHKRHPPESEHLPPISPFAPDSTRPPSSPTR